MSDDARTKLVERVEARFRERLDRLLAATLQKYPELTAPAGYTERIARTLTEHAYTAVGLIIDTEAHQRAALDRAEFVDHWPLSRIPTDDNRLFELMLEEATAASTAQDRSHKLDKKAMGHDFVHEATILGAGHVGFVHARVREDAARKMVPLPASKESRSAML